MNILILNWRDIRHPLSGGAEISLFEHAKYWAKKRAQVTWFASSFKNAKQKEEIEGVKIMRRGSHYSAHFFAFMYYMLGKFGKPDIVVDSFHFLPFFTPLYMKEVKIVGLINEVAGSVWFANIVFPFSLIGYLLEPLFFIFYKRKRFITSSLSAKKELVKLGIPEQNIQNVQHGVTVGKVEGISKEKEPTVIFLGRISRDKGIRDALEAFGMLFERINDLQIWVVGKEEKKGYLGTLLKDKRFSNLAFCLKYFNYVSESKKFELLKKAWILVHPSRKEGWGLNVIEAASQGTPTVGYDREGLRDSIVDGKTGLLTDSNPVSLANTIAELISNKNLYNKLSEGAADWAKKFSWKKSNEESWEILIAS